MTWFGFCAVIALFQVTHQHPQKTKGLQQGKKRSPREPRQKLLSVLLRRRPHRDLPHRPRHLPRKGQWELHRQEPQDRQNVRRRVLEPVHEGRHEDAHEIHARAFDDGADGLAERGRERARRVERLVPYEGTEGVEGCEDDLRGEEEGRGEEGLETEGEGGGEEEEFGVVLDEVVDEVDVVVED